MHPVSEIRLIVGFLQIQSVDTHTESPRRSPIQILAYISVFFSVGTIVTGLFLLRHQGVLRVNKSSTVGSFLCCNHQTLTATCRSDLLVKNQDLVYRVWLYSIVYPP